MEGDGCSHAFSNDRMMEEGWQHMLLECDEMHHVWDWMNGFWEVYGLYQHVHFVCLGMYSRGHARMDGMWCGWAPRCLVHEGLSLCLDSSCVGVCDVQWDVCCFGNKTRIHYLLEKDR